MIPLPRCVSHLSRLPRAQLAERERLSMSPRTPSANKALESKGEGRAAPKVAKGTGGRLDKSRRDSGKCPGHELPPALVAASARISATCRVAREMALEFHQKAAACVSRALGAAQRRLPEPRPLPASLKRVVRHRMFIVSVAILLLALVAMAGFWSGSGDSDDRQASTMEWQVGFSSGGVGVPGWVSLCLEGVVSCDVGSGCRQAEMYWLDTVSGKVGSGHALLAVFGNRASR